ncbi:MAG TPA: response regulator [Leptospiraceae bacterium]|nr:response regulator [Leptospiraceae bacterium]HMW05890.1 response regulator [Leptospiraceae bacterium]HMY32745.1 response regulator [Leptospiraceae bacterium]HMZ62552.1 response regulator [Leptospiraceae bacterium]HNA05785.1 response regulator [Leptospiraceae bacterium]
MIKVLCIDDDAITLMLCTTTIKKSGLSSEIITLLNGQEGVDYYNKLTSTIGYENHSFYPDLIFLDLNMPILNGWEFLDYFMEDHYPKLQKTKVVILSSTVDPRDKEKAKQYPIVIDFFSKPITNEMLSKLSYKLN